MAHTGCGAQVLTCNYEPFIGHNVNCAAKEHTAHNTELLNHNHLKEKCLLEPHVTHLLSNWKKIMNELKLLSVQTKPTLLLYNSAGQIK